MEAAKDLLTRTRALGLAVLRLDEGLPRSEGNRVLLRQLIRSATSVGANYRAARRAQSVADMIAKLKRVEEEADETDYWLDLLEEANPSHASSSAPLRQECNEITAMVVASIKTLRRKAGS